MSQKKIEKITFKNFKAFRNEETIDFKNKNVLIYGNNGSGKSSIFWALYTFLQSSIKTEANVKKYFKVFNENDPTTFQTLRNIFEEEGEESYIDLTISEGSVKTKRRISLDNIDTIQNADILTLNATSDFINYKLLSSFYNSSHKYDVNLWHVFERDIFPYLVNTVTDQTYLEYIKDKTFDAPRYPSGYVFKQGWQKDQYISQLNVFNQEIQSLLTKIQLTANDFLKEHFFNNEDVLKVELKFDKTFTFDLLEKRIWLEDNKHLRESKLGIKLIVHQFNKTTGNWISLQRVQSLLNEAQLTRIAVSIRIGALRTRIQDTYPKILVLDDMLISLDMANRIEVTKIILNFNNKPTLNFFDSYQKIILTHDKGFYNILKNYTNSNEWEYYNLHKKENSNDAPVLVNEKSHIEKALEHIPDIILCDIMMPKLDGYAVFEYLSTNPRTSNIPFIYLTAKSEKEDIRKGMNLGVDDYLIKPFEEEDLLGAITCRLKKKEFLHREFSKNISGVSDFLDEASAYLNLEELSKNRSVIKYKSKEDIFTEGSSAHQLYFLQSGNVKIYRTTEAGKEFVIGLFGPGDFIGQLSLLASTGTYAESATVLEDAEVLAIPKEDFMQLLYENKEVSNKFFGMISNNIIELQEQLVDMAFATVRQRTAKTLLELDKKGMMKDETHIGINISREDFAGLIGTATETAIRMLTEFKKEGLIGVEPNRRLILLDKNRLKQVANNH